MLEFLLFIVVVCVVGLAYVRLQSPRPSSPRFRRVRELLAGWPGDDDADEPRRAALSMSMFNSLANPRRARASDGAIFVAAGPHVAVASTRDAAVIHGSLDFFDEDVNKLIDLNRSSMRLKNAGPIRIHYVIEDESVADGVPYLLTDSEARVRARAARSGGAALRDPSEEATPNLESSASGIRATGPAGDQPRDRVLPPIAGSLVPQTPGLRAITVTAPGQTLGRNPAHGKGTVDVPTVSWDHARIGLSQQHDAWTITDLSSRYGTRVNGRDIKDHGGPHGLSDGDTVGLGPDAEYVWSSYGTGYTPTG